MKDKNYLHNMFNSTCTDDGNGDIETYENWLERQLLARIERLEQLAIPRVSIELPDDAIHFAEWLDIVGIRDGRFDWKYKADNYKQKYTTKEMFAEWKRILGN